MSSDDRTLGGPVPGLLLVLDEALYAILALVVLILATALLGGWAEVAVAGVLVVCVLVIYGIRDRSPRAVERRRALARFLGALDPAERRLHKVVRWVPYVVFFGTMFGGAEPGTSGAAMLGTFLVAHLLFGLWLQARHAGARSRA